MPDVAPPFGTPATTQQQHSADIAVLLALTFLVGLAAVVTGFWIIQNKLWAPGWVLVALLSFVVVSGAIRAGHEIIQRYKMHLWLRDERYRNQLRLHARERQQKGLPESLPDPAVPIPPRPSAVWFAARLLTWMGTVSFLLLALFDYVKSDTDLGTGFTDVILMSTLIIVLMSALIIGGPVVYAVLVVRQKRAVTLRDKAHDAHLAQLWRSQSSADTVRLSFIP